MTVHTLISAINNLLTLQNDLQSMGKETFHMHYFISLFSHVQIFGKLRNPIVFSHRDFIIIDQPFFLSSGFNMPVLYAISNIYYFLHLIILTYTTCIILQFFLNRDFPLPRHFTQCEQTRIYTQTTNCEMEKPLSS